MSWMARRSFVEVARSRAGWLGRPGHGGEARVVALEAHRDAVDRAGSVLGDDDVGLARPVGLAVAVGVGPVEQHDDVSVLLDRAGLTQVGELRGLVGALL